MKIDAGVLRSLAKGLQYPHEEEDDFGSLLSCVLRHKPPL